MGLTIDRLPKPSQAVRAAVGVALAAVALAIAVEFIVGRFDPEARPSQPQSICDIAPGDGEVAVAAAIASCPDGAVVRFPRGGVYHQAASIKLQGRANLTIDGNGSTFVSNAANNEQFNPNWMVIDASNVTLHSMRVEGNFRMEQPRSLERMQEDFPSGNHFNAGITVYGGKGVTVRDTRIQDTFGDGILVAPSGILPGGAGANAGIPRDVRLQRLTITRTARQGVAITGGVGIWLEDSYIADSWYLGIDLEIDVPGQPLQDVHILRNRFDGMFFGAIALPWPGDGRSIDGIEIRGNRTLSAPDGCNAQISINATPGQTATVANIVTEENHLLTRSRGIVYRNVSSGVVAANQVERRPGPPCGDPDAAPVIVSQSPGVVVDRNIALNY